MPKKFLANFSEFLENLWAGTQCKAFRLFAFIAISVFIFIFSKTHQGLKAIPLAKLNRMKPVACLVSSLEYIINFDLTQCNAGPSSLKTCNEQRSDQSGNNYASLLLLLLFFSLKYNMKLKQVPHS